MSLGLPTGVARQQARPRPSSIITMSPGRKWFSQSAALFSVPA